eukprot:g8985.t1
MPVYTLNTTEIRMQQTLKSSCPFGSSIQSISASGVVTCHTDMDSGGDITALTTGSGITGGGTNGDISISVDYTTVQKRTSSMQCSDGSAVQTLYENGTLGCTDVYNGDITAVTASDGLLGGGTNGDISLSVDFSTVQKRGTSMECASQSISASGVVTCHTDMDSGGDITSVNIGDGLNGGGTAGDISISIDYTKIQKRISGDNAMICGNGNSMQGLYENGTIKCVDVFNGDITSVVVGTGLLGGGTSGDLSIALNFATVQKRGTSMKCSSGSYVQSIFANGTVECKPDENS